MIDETLTATSASTRASKTVQGQELLQKGATHATAQVVRAAGVSNTTAWEVNLQAKVIGGIEWATIGALASVDNTSIYTFPISANVSYRFYLSGTTSLQVLLRG